MLATQEGDHYQQAHPILSPFFRALKPGPWLAFYRVSSYWLASNRYTYLKVGTVDGMTQGLYPSVLGLQDHRRPSVDSCGSVLLAVSHSSHPAYLASVGMWEITSGTLLAHCLTSKPPLARSALIFSVRCLASDCRQLST